MKNSGELGRAILVTIFLFGTWYTFSEAREALSCKRYIKAGLSFFASLFVGFLAVVSFLVFYFPELFGIR
jgi:hypothetical protein